MSYSFNARGATVAAVLAAVAAKFDEVVARDPVHAIDREKAEGAVAAMVGLLTPNTERDIVVSVSGYVSGQWGGDAPPRLSSASVGVSAGLVDRLPA